MRILFDTNVLVSAFVTGGSCYDVIDYSIYEHEIYYTPFIIDEFIKVFKNKFHFSDPIIHELVLFIDKYFIKGNTASAVDNVCKDTSDNQLLANAVINNIDVIITDDKELLDLKNYKEIRIISPKEYWSMK